MHLFRPADPVASCAADIRALSVYRELTELMTLALAESHGDSPEAQIATRVCVACYEVRRGLEPMIERLAKEAATAEQHMPADEPFTGRYIDETFSAMSSAGIEDTLAQRKLEGLV